MDELPIGRRVAYWRNRRKMSQQVFADRLGKSKSWVDKVERGVRRLDKFSVVYEIAEVLQLDAQLLLARDTDRRSDGSATGDQIEIEEIRSALERYDQIGTLFTTTPTLPNISELGKAVNHAWLSFQHARYGALVRGLPRLLRDAQSADNACQRDNNNSRVTCETAHLLAQVYQITSSALRKLGEHELSWLAADRSVAVAQRSGDRLLAGIASYRVALAMLALGRARSALEINVNVANMIAPGVPGNPVTGERLSVYGMLLLQGAMSAAAIGHSGTVRDLLQGAEDAARVLGSDQNHYWTSFGPTNVKLHRVAAMVELGEGQLAIEAHKGLDPVSFEAMMPERRAHHYLDVARGYVQLGDPRSASEMLLKGDRLASSEIRCRPLAREVLGDVLRAVRGAPSAPVAELAELMGVGV